MTSNPLTRAVAKTINFTGRRDLSPFDYSLEQHGAGVCVFRLEARKLKSIVGRRTDGDTNLTVRFRPKGSHGQKIEIEHPLSKLSDEGFVLTGKLSGIHRPAHLGVRIILSGPDHQIIAEGSKTAPDKIEQGCPDNVLKPDTKPVKGTRLRTFRTSLSAMFILVEDPDADDLIDVTYRDGSAFTSMPHLVVHPDCADIFTSTTTPHARLPMAASALKTMLHLLATRTRTLREAPFFDAWQAYAETLLPDNDISYLFGNGPDDPLDDDTRDENIRDAVAYFVKQTGLMPENRIESEQED